MHNRSQVAKQQRPRSARKHASVAGKRLWDLEKHLKHPREDLDTL